MPTQTYEGIEAREIFKEISCDPWLEKHFPCQDMSKKILDELERVRAEVQGKYGHLWLLSYQYGGNSGESN